MPGWLNSLFGREAPSRRLRQQRTAPVSFADANNVCACALYDHLRQQRGNLFISPFSIRVALAMIRAGARGETATQIDRALCLDASNGTVDDAFARACEGLGNAGGHSADGELVIANALWAQEGTTLDAVFLDVVRRCYGGTVDLTDFARAAHAVRSINRWVDENTRGRIRDIVSTADLHPDTRLMLASAIYFKGKWEFPFSEAFTSDAPFFVEGGGTVDTRLMCQHLTLGYVQGDESQAVDLSYKGSDLSMLVLLPDRQHTLRQLEATVSAPVLKGCVARMRLTNVVVFLPRFTIRRNAHIRGLLESLGVNDAFDPARADLSGINGLRAPDPNALFIADVIHEAFIEVDESGTKAAAVTIADMPLASAMRRRRTRPIPEFRADRPFLFAMRDRRTGAILFLGRVTDPSAR